MTQTPDEAYILGWVALLFVIYIGGLATYFVLS